MRILLSKELWKSGIWYPSQQMQIFPIGHGRGYEIQPHVVVPLIRCVIVVHGYDTHGITTIKNRLIEIWFISCRHGT